MPATRTEFLSTYRTMIMVEFPWASDVAKLDRFMVSVERTVSTTAATWNHDSNVAKKAYRSIGATGPYSRKALRELPV